MDTVSDAGLIRPEEAGRTVLATGPRAVPARFDPETNRIAVEPTEGCGYAFPAALVQDLRGASAEQLSGVLVDGYGFNLNFPALDVDLYVPALVPGIFGMRAWTTKELALIAGRTKSPAKASAARANGSKGGRPKKAA